MRESILAPAGGAEGRGERWAIGRIGRVVGMQLWLGCPVGHGGYVSRRGQVSFQLTYLQEIFIIRVAAGKKKLERKWWGRISVGLIRTTEFNSSTIRTRIAYTTSIYA